MRRTGGSYTLHRRQKTLANSTNFKITLLNDDESKLVKASEISGIKDMLFLRESTTGKVIAKPNKKTSALNKELHNND